MNQQNYHCSITANITAGKAAEGINNVAGWWTTNIEGSSEKLSDVFTVRFSETFVTFKIVEAVTGQKTVWLVTDCYLHWLADKQEWNGTKISFEISAKGNSTQVDFTHIGLVPEAECYGTCVKGWDFFIKQSLFKLLNDGKGLPEVPKMERAVAQ